jgi:ribosome maturation factor RimP
MYNELEKIVKYVCEENNTGMYDIDIKNTHKGMVIIVYITKVGGVLIDDCSRIGRKLKEEIETQEIFDGPFFLEVSSPGIERNLRLKRHYASAINEIIKVTYSVDDRKISKIGTLKEVQPDKLVLELKDVNEIVEIYFKDIKKARTYFDFKIKKEK